MPHFNWIDSEEFACAKICLLPPSVAYPRGKLGEGPNTTFLKYDPRDLSKWGRKLSRRAFPAFLRVWREWHIGSCKILYVMTPWSKEIKDFTVSHGLANGSLLSLWSPLTKESWYIGSCMTSVPKIFAISSLKDPWFQGIGPETVEICKNSQS